MDSPIWHGHSDSSRSLTEDDRSARCIRHQEIRRHLAEEMPGEDLLRPVDHDEDDSVPAGLLSKKHLEHDRRIQAVQRIWTDHLEAERHGVAVAPCGVRIRPGAEQVRCERIPAIPAIAFG